ncbi:MAG: undecaprenyl-diphosphatase UppP [Patescibacteria group bacterium]
MEISIWQAIILGLVQGLGEFLPISSSGHLVITPWLFGFSDPGLSFDVALHAGTLLAVGGYFWKDWMEIFKRVLKNETKNEELITNSYGKNTLWLLVLATIPGVLAGYFLEERAETVFRSPLLVAFTLGFVGLILYLVDKFSKHRKDLKKITWKDALLIGLSQALAIIPGVSRSGATITAGLALGLGRVSAARFSFLLATPIIFGATIYKLPELFRNEFTLVMFVGVLVSTLSGYLAIKYLLKFVEKTSYAIFFWYRLVLAGAILGLYLWR